MIGQEAIVIIWLPLIIILAIILMKRNTSFLRTLGALVVATYLCALIAVTIFPIPFQARLLADLRAEGNYLSNNIEPFKTIMDVFALGEPSVAFRQLAGNFFLFIPLTFLLPAFWKKFRSFKSTFFALAATSFGIEILQFIISTIVGFTYKIADIDDLILNISGGMLGYAFFILLQRIINSKFFQTKRYTAQDI